VNGILPGWCCFMKREKGNRSQNSHGRNAHSHCLSGKVGEIEMEQFAPHQPPADHFPQ